MKTTAPLPGILPHDADVFFEAYAKRVNNALMGGQPDLDGTMAAFADCFVEASPAGIICGKNDHSFRAAIPKGYSFYKQTGMKAMVIEAKELTMLNELHAMVKVHWRSDHERRNGSDVSISFEVIYLLQQQKTGLKIFAYITGDEQQAMKDNGVLPEEG